MLFIIYIKVIISEWHKQNHISIPINQTTHMDVILFADNQVLLVKNEDDLQRSIHSLSKVVIIQYGNLHSRIKSHGI
jgi:uncharacterized membrane protein YobD (UPF0266 family)